MNTKAQKEINSDELCWNGTLHCHWDSWRVISEFHLALDLPYQNVPDMRGTINIAKILSNNVERVDVYSGGILNVQYHWNHYSEEWEALIPNEEDTILAC